MPKVDRNVIRFFAIQATFGLSCAAINRRCFSMTENQIKDRQALPNKAKSAPPSAPDDRDATIERLERAIAEESQHTAKLRKAAEESRFKAEILEKSYAKQLKDARLRSEVAERELADLKARMAELETAHEDAKRLLTKTRTELEFSPSDRVHLGEALASTGGTEIDQHDAESPVEKDSLTIDELMRDSNWTEDHPPVDREKEHSETQTDQDSPPEEMISPDLVFTVKGGENS